jgi:lipid A ethanolaminephosphotransferase
LQNKLSTTKIIVITALFLTLFDNVSFFKNLIKVYPVTFENIWFLTSIFIVLVSFIIFLFSLVSSKYTTKPILILIVFISAFTNYFMNTYNVVIDHGMIQNALNTDMEESLDLLSLELILYVLFLGILPSYLIYKANIHYGSFKEELIQKIKLLLISLGLIVALVFLFSKFYTSFFREHKPLRLYTNPTFYIYSAVKHINNVLNSGPIVVQQIGLDAKVVKKTSKKRVVVLVIGEAVRANRFSLNGYERDTNPLLKQEDIINFSNVSSCGTSTAVSVPCMLSIFDRADYSYKKEIHTENILDVLGHAGVDVLWRDNSGNWSYLVDYGEFQNYKTKELNTVFDIESRDEGMIVGLDEYIDSKQNDIFIVLHQMGNHGPAYYKRYPESFKKYTPVCETNQLEDCTKESIGNAYDNALLYTDYFLSKLINSLKKRDDLETAMIYMSDHGQSLGENGVYLHGMPYFMAPSNQTHIPAVMWFSKNFGSNKTINLKNL